jgi:hypothetical protein
MPNSHPMLHRQQFADSGCEDPEPPFQPRTGIGRRFDWNARKRPTPGAFDGYHWAASFFDVRLTRSGG